MTRIVVLAGAALAILAPGVLHGASPPVRPGPAIVLGPCAEYATGRCGTLRVPENPARPNGRRIGIRVLVFPALDPARRDGRTALFFLAGGPGGAASESAGWATTAFADYWQRHDLVFVDQRGTGGVESPRLPARSVRSTSRHPRVPSGVPGAPACRRVDADPRFYTTSVAMDDLDAVRAALGYERLDLYGISYGATAAQIYLRRHERRVRSAILDGGTLLHIPIFERWAPNGQRVLDRLFARCRRDAGCRAAFPDPAGDLARVQESLRQTPVRIAGVTVTPAVVARLVQSLTVKPEKAAYVPLLLHLAAQGRYAGRRHAGATA